jgi:hypothetical protein
MMALTPAHDGRCHVQHRLPFDPLLQIIPFKMVLMLNMRGIFHPSNGKEEIFELLKSK